MQHAIHAAEVHRRAPFGPDMPRSPEPSDQHETMVISIEQLYQINHLVPVCTSSMGVNIFGGKPITRRLVTVGNCSFRTGCSEMVYPQNWLVSLLVMVTLGWLVGTTNYQHLWTNPRPPLFFKRGPGTPRILPGLITSDVSRKSAAGTDSTKPSISSRWAGNDRQRDSQ